ncbi:unnamed protein product [Pleuronectes platessa]|uniref:Uncharacterized protein n=1 Tax=Pleuronectes platessa TaxID=8262 RepID=A0A9N7UKD8_PLEPL|nr:unnamed protein product [Pleuronectes platessa]
MSSSGLREMDVLHFTAHRICRGNHSGPQRTRAAVLKLSIVLAVMSPASLARPTRGPQRDEAVTAENMKLFEQSSPEHSAEGWCLDRGGGRTKALESSAFPNGLLLL